MRRKELFPGTVQEFIKMNGGGAGIEPRALKGPLRVSEGQGGTMPPEPLGTGSGTGCQYEWDFRKAEGSLAKVRRLSEMKEIHEIQKKSCQKRTG